MDEEPPTVVDEVVVVARRHQNGSSYIAFYVRLNGGTTEWPFTILDQVVISSDATITIEPNPELPNIVFETSVPAKSLKQLIAWLIISINNLGPLTPAQQKIVDHYRAVFNHLMSNNLTLVYADDTNGLLDSDTAMGVISVRGPNGELTPRIVDNRITILVNPAIFGSNQFQTQGKLLVLMLHELLHLSPTFNAQAVLDFQRLSRGRSWEVWHQDYFQDAASIMYGILINVTQPGERTTIEAAPGGQSIHGNDPDGNIVIGGTGNDEIWVEGAVNRVDPGAGVNKIHFGSASRELRVSGAVAGSNNTLIVDGPYTFANNIAVEYFNGHIYIGLDIAGGYLSASEMANCAIIFGFQEGAPGVGSVKVGSQTKTIQQVRDMHNFLPRFLGGMEAHVYAPFTGGPVAGIAVQDNDGDPVTLTVVSVTGWGSNKSWSIQNGALVTNTQWLPNAFNETTVLLEASDGKDINRADFTVRWRPDPDSGVIEP